MQSLPTSRGIRERVNMVNWGYIIHDEAALSPDGAVITGRCDKGTY